MSMQFSSAPYFDDFDPTKNFYKILFKPGYAVQARELNQLQSILLNQVNGVSSHLFKKNTMVIPGGVSLSTVADIVNISGNVNPASLVGKTITNAPSFDPTDDTDFDTSITAVVLGYEPATESLPAAIFVKYFKTDADGRMHFNKSETLKTVDRTGEILTFSVDSTYGTSIGKVATAAKGLFYTKNLFVDVDTQSIIIDRDRDTVTNRIVGFKVVESIVTSDDDESLLDNAAGAPNQYAPGADRYKVALELTSVDIGTTVSEDNFITLMTIENNVITYINNKTQYAELMKTLARRTYDTNGNFIVSGLNATVNEATDDAYIWANVSKGKCYLGGYEYDQIFNLPLAIEKPRSEAYQEAIPIANKFATGLTYFYIAGGGYLNEIPVRDTLVEFLNAMPGVFGVATIGYGVFRDIQYSHGDIESDGVYKAYFDNISFEKGFSISDIGGFKAITASEGAPILHVLRLSNLVGSMLGDITSRDGSDITSYAGQPTTFKGVVDTVSNLTGFNPTPYDMYRVLSDGHGYVWTGSTWADAGLLSSQSCMVHNQSGTSYYVIKNYVNRPVPDARDVWSGGGSDGSATRISTFISNYSPKNVPLIRIDNNTIKTLYRSTNGVWTNNTSYSVTGSYVFQVSGISDTPPTSYREETPELGSNEVFDSLSTASFMGFVEKEGGDDFPLDVSGLITIAEDRKTFAIELTDITLNGANVIVFATIIKSNITQTQKTSVSHTVKIAEPSSSYMALAHQDVIGIDKIVHGSSVNVETATWIVEGGVVTITTTSAHGLGAGDVVVVKDIKSGLNPTGIFGIGYNGRFIVATTPEPDKFTINGMIGSTEVYDTGGIVYLPANINADVDITSRFTFDSGQTPFAYGTGFIKLKKRAIPPVGQIAVKYKYYALSGDASYMSVDSYGNHQAADLSYIGQIPDIKFVDGEIYNTRSFMDFRVRTSNYFFKNVGTYTYSSNVGTLALKDLNLSSLGVGTLVDKYVIGPGHRNGVQITSVRVNHTTGNTELILGEGKSTSNHSGIFYIGLNTDALSLVDTNAGGVSFPFPREGDLLSYSYTRFLPKQLMVYVNRDGDKLNIKYDVVESYNDVLALRRNEFKLPLLYIYMNPYTLGIQDVSVSKFENPVYHMLDIHDIKLRVDRNEYYTSLALNNDIHQQIVDAQNEDVTEASYGFWNEDFMDMSVQATADNDFACTIYDKSYAAPGTITRTIRLELLSNLNTDTWKRTGTNITLPYTEMRYIGNQFASTFNNLNPYNVINWVGKMTLTPSVDNWVDVTVLPTKEIATLDITTKTAPVVVVPPPTVVEPPVILPPPPPPPAPEVVTQINNLRTSWGPDSWGGRHAITFDWVTSTGRTGRVNTDMHLSSIVRDRGHNGVYARSLINRRYADNDVRQYLQAGTHFDQRPPSAW